jgi:hypothetical protein
MTDGTMSTAAVRFVLGALQPVGSARRVISSVAALADLPAAACDYHGADGQPAREKRLMREFQAP